LDPPQPLETAGDFEVVLPQGPLLGLYDLRGKEGCLLAGPLARRDQDLQQKIRGPGGLQRVRSMRGFAGLDEIPSQRFRFLVLSGLEEPFDLGPWGLILRR